MIIIFNKCKNSNQQGAIGLGQAVSYFTRQRCIVSLPLIDAQDYDLIVDNLVCLNKVQVKTTNHKEGKHYQVNLVNGSHSSRKNIKLNTEKVYEFLFVLTGADEVFVIPKQEIEHLKTSITLSDKYSKYKVS